MHTTTSNLMKSILVLTLAFLGLWTDLRADTRPNIVWIIPDDMSVNFSCYGETAIQTPHVDALARRGMKFTRAFVTAPVCSTCRSAFITGMYQTSIGAHHHRSGRGDQKIRLPKHIQLVPALFQKAAITPPLPVGPAARGDWARPITILNGIPRCTTARTGRIANRVSRFSHRSKRPAASCAARMRRVGRKSPRPLRPSSAGVRLWRR